MEETFRQDLEEDLLADSRTWEAIRNHPSIQRAIPLPSSNSPAAKKMRIAAGLVIYGKALAEHVLRPTYILRDREIDKTLNILGSKDPLHEAYVRAVLLKILPDKQKQHKEACVKKAVMDILDSMGSLLPARQREIFESDLWNVSNKLCDTWRLAQRLEEKVEPSFSFTFPEDWKPLPPSSVQTVAKPPPNTAMSHKDKERQRSQGATDQTLQMGEGTARIVWPTFLYSSSQQDGEALLLYPGYVLTQPQMREADEEMSRRAARRTMRQNGPAVAGKRRDSGIFLSARS